MKRFAVIMILLASWVPAHADIFKIETNDYSTTPVPIVWSGKLVELDADTGIAKVAYRVGSQKHELLVHYSRFYSVTFDSQDVVGYTFPLTRQDLTTRIGKLTKVREKMLLSNDGFLDGALPAEVKVVPNRSAPQYLLQGGLVSIDGGTSGITALTEDRSMMSFVIHGSFLINWIRG